MPESVGHLVVSAEWKSRFLLRGGGRSRNLHLVKPPSPCFLTLSCDVPHLSTATNSAGQAVREVKVHVQGRGGSLASSVLHLGRLPVPPTIIPDQISYNVIEGDSVRMSCEAGGDPPPIVVWNWCPAHSNSSLGVHGGLAGEGRASERIGARWARTTR